MGQVAVEQIVSVDGFAAAADGGIDYFQSAGDFAETEDEQLKFLKGVDAVVLGRRTYEMFSSYWPTADPAVERIAKPINALPKHVFSSTLPAAPWGEFPAATVERGDVVAGVETLRERYRGDVVIWGSLTLTEALFSAGVVDRLRLRIVPVLIGAGRSLAPTIAGNRTLKLESALSYPRGHVALSYALGPRLGGH